MTEGQQNVNPQPAGQGDEKLFSQQDLNRILNMRLNEERARFSDYDQLKQQAQAVQQTQQQLAAAQQRTLQLSVAWDLGLPRALAERLRGTDEASIRADAATLMASLPTPAQTPATPPPPAANPTPPPAANPAPATPPAPVSPANPAAGPALTLEQIKQMSPEQINEQWEAVQAVLKRGR